MATPKQIAANQSNAKKSTGPKTETGKQKTGQVTLMPTEDRTAFTTFTQNLINSLQPATAIEQQLAQAIAHDSWRLNRMKAIEDNILALGEANSNSDNPEIQAALNAAEAFSQNPAKFQLLTLYIQRTNREIHRNLQLLRQIQTERRAQRLTALEESSRLKQLADKNQIPCPPDAYPEMRAVVTGDRHEIGFEFSTEDIETFNIHKSIRKPAQSNPFDLLLPHKRAA
jgi:hypothetical protein